MNIQFGRLCLTALAACLFACGGSGDGEGPPRMANVCPDNPSLCGGTCCGSACVDPTTDTENCGACGNSCGTTSMCTNGTCGCPPSGNACSTGQTCCSTNGCKSLADDVNNCGSCGNACGSGSSCVSGQCTCGSATCATGQVCCNGQCAATCSTSGQDAGMSMPGQDAGECGCTKTCIVECDNDGCCFEDEFLGTCTPNPNCL